MKPWIAIDGHEIGTALCGEGIYPRWLRSSPEIFAAIEIDGERFALDRG